MQSLGNTEWLLNRAANKPAVAQSLGVLDGQTISVRELGLSAAKGIGLVPAWVVLTTVLIATTAICATVIMRSRAELRASSVQLQDVQSEIQSLRETNQVLQRDILRLTHDPGAIEVAARQRLGMVKANDIVVTMGSISTSARMSNVSFVR